MFFLDMMHICENIEKIEFVVVFEVFELIYEETTTKKYR